MERKMAMETLSLMVGSRLHDQWRAPRLREDGTYEPRLKPTEDAQWIAAHGGQKEVDIANTSFENLPSDWKRDNLLAGQVAVALTFEPGMTMEEMASEVHEDWLRRQGQWAKPEQKLPFAQLSEEEKQKDIDHILLALSIREKVLSGEISLESEAIRYGLMTAPAVTLSSVEKQIKRTVEQSEE